MAPNWASLSANVTKGIYVGFRLQTCQPRGQRPSCHTWSSPLALRIPALLSPELWRASQVPPAQSPVRCHLGDEGLLQSSHSDCHTRKARPSCDRSPHLRHLSLCPSFSGQQQGHVLTFTFCPPERVPFLHEGAGVPPGTWDASSGVLAGGPVGHT